MKDFIIPTLLDNYTTEDFKKLALEIIDTEEFEVYKKDNGKLALHDLQGANLGDIQEEEFDDLADIICRLEIYHNDYFEEDLRECIKYEFDNDLYKDDLYKILDYAENNMEEFADYEFDIRALELIYYYFNELTGIGID